MTYPTLTHPDTFGQFGLAGATLLGGLALLLQHIRRDKKVAPGNAGSMSKEYWQMEMRKAVSDVLEPWLRADQSTKQEISKSLAEISKSLAVMAALEERRGR